MNPSIILRGDDHARLQSLLNHDCHGPWPDPDQAAVLGSILEVARVTEEDSALDAHAGLGDQIALVSTTDSRDFFSFQIVTPHEANLDLDKLPVTLPISLAVLGRRVNAVVSWETPRGTREMRIVAVKKCERYAIAG